MKKILALLLALCLVLGIVSAALAAAGAPKITKQPVSATTDKNGKVTFSIKVKNAKAITWYFINPANGEEITARNISKLFKGLKVANPNGTNLTLKKVPQEMHNWSLYCHLTGNGYHINSDIVQLKVYGMPDDEVITPEPASASDVQADPAAVTPEPVTATPEPASVSDVQAEPAAVTPQPAPASDTQPEGFAETPAPEDPFHNAEDDALLSEATRQITISAQDLILCPLDARGNPLEDQQASTLTFEGADNANVEVRSGNPVKYWVINGIRIEPIGANVNAFILKNVTTDLTISAQFDLASQTPAAELDTSIQCQVTCTGCSFTYLAGGLKSVASGSVPSGATIIVLADNRDAAQSGYRINGGEAEQTGKLSFRLTITEDTVITLP